MPKLHAHKRKETAMKTILSLLISLFIANASATGYDPVLISGTSMQIASLKNTTVSNIVFGNSSTAQQNLASNTGGVVITGSSVQMMAAHGSYARNEVIGSDSMASQNFSSNLGDTRIGGRSMQMTSMQGAYAYNSAQGHSTYAIQNIASNNACFSCPSGNCGTRR
jgi:hypothetical protein